MTETETERARETERERDRERQRETKRDRQRESIFNLMSFNLKVLYIPFVYWKGAIPL